MVTLKDVAREAGVSVGTASQALRGVGEVAPGTRQYVQAVAERLGYRRNAAAAALAAQRPGRTERKRQLTLALLVLTDPQELSVRPRFVEQCRLLGFDSQVVDMRHYAGNAHALSRQLWNRGVDGVLWVPVRFMQQRDWWLEFDWSLFSVVQINDGFPELPLHRVRTSAFEETLEILRRVCACGYRRILCLLPETQSMVDDRRRLGGFEAFRQLDAPEGLEIHVLRLYGWERPSELAPVYRAIRSFRPEVVFGHPWSIVLRLQESGYRVPADFAFVGPQGPSPGEYMHAFIAGCTNRFPELVGLGIQRLQRLVTLTERGVPEHFEQIVLPPIWHAGASLPSIGPSESGVEPAG